MVVNWSPEPSKCMDGGAFSLRDTQIILDPEDSEDEANASPYFGYELLPHDTQNSNMDGEANSEAESEPEEAVILSIEQPVNGTNGGEKCESEDETPRPDIEINQEEVRSIMSNITLPPSSYPTWATDIPESQWTSFLVSRMTSLQNETLDK